MQKTTTAQGGDSLFGTILTVLATLFVAFLMSRPGTSVTTVAARRGPKPDVVLFVADDLGMNDAGYAWTPGGPAALPTPRLDALAAESLVLDAFYAQPMCTPARAALLTGRAAHRLGLAYFVLLANQPTGLPVEEVTVADRLRGAGYSTHMVGKWHLGFARSGWLPTARGFDSFFGFCLGAQDYVRHESAEWLEGSLAEGPRRLEGSLAEDPRERGHDLWRDAQPVPRSPATDGVHSSELFAGEAVGAVRAAPWAKPLFLYFAAQTPHAHYTEGTPQRFRDAARVAGFEPDAPRFRVAALAAALDEQAGTVLNAVRGRAGKDGLVFWFLGDNGPEPGTGASAHPLRGAKRTVFEGGLRTPSFVYAPGRLKPGRTSAVTTMMDVTPTLLTWAGAPVFSVDGRAMQPVFADGGLDAERVLVLFFDGVTGCGAVRKGQYKYVKNGGCANPTPEYAGWEGSAAAPNCLAGECLFDLARDPAERVDVKAHHPGVTDALRAALLAAEAEAAPSLVLTTPGDP
eukprot:CAMPEP_0119291218 /NCGR_PEP_ID=MMETSP1329-20130426/42088_1 /TAXON_ID=114041 /ORGANISM="Genus nov. species nov., Strain RCC1024" /LENGTH=515 /DNA_ID=CAMNT_0007292045 /DNA_START=83 /DNA_END=1627 /DNA_ORIENTATION=-